MTTPVTLVELSYINNREMLQPYKRKKHAALHKDEIPEAIAPRDCAVCQCLAQPCFGRATQCLTAANSQHKSVNRRYGASNVLGRRVLCPANTS